MPDPLEKETVGVIPSVNGLHCAHNNWTKGGLSNTREKKHNNITIGESRDHLEPKGHHLPPHGTKSDRFILPEAHSGKEDAIPYSPILVA